MKVRVASAVTALALVAPGGNGGTAPAVRLPDSLPAGLTAGA
jgi:hypothetical protein